MSKESLILVFPYKTVDCGDTERDR